MNISASTVNCRSNFLPKSRSWASLSLLIYVLLGLLIQGASLAADPQEIFQKVQQAVAADPKQADAIVSSTLASLSAGKRQRLASGIFAAALKGLGNPTLAQALSLFTAVFDASPDSVGALLKVAYANFPANLGAFMGAGIKAALALGRADLVPHIVTDAIILAPDQQRTLTSLALGLVPEDLRRPILKAIAALHSFPGPGPLGGTTNPSNNGGAPTPTPTPSPGQVGQTSNPSSPGQVISNEQP